MNIVYTNFLKAYLQNNVTLTGDSANAFKMALFSSEYRPDSSDKKYDSLVKEGFEIQGSGYESGGKDIKFTLLASSDNILEFQGTRISWTNATFITRYGIIYRVSDGMLVSCYDFGVEQTVDNGTFSLSWKGSPTISITLNDLTKQAEGLTPDSVLSLNSSNSVENRVLTKVFESLGVRIGEEDLPEESDSINENIDSLNRVSIKDIDEMFGIYHKVRLKFDTQSKGDNPEEINTDAYVKVILPSIEYKGYDFVGWYSDPSCEDIYFIGKASEKVTFSKEENLILYAKWARKTYNVTWDPQNDDEALVFQVSYEDMVTLPSSMNPPRSFTKEGFNFIGWFDDPEAGDQISGEEKITENVTYYAHWEAIKEPASIIYSYMGIPSKSSETVETYIGDTITLKDPDLPEGYTFLGWYTEQVQQGENFKFVKIGEAGDSFTVTEKTTELIARCE